MTRSGGGPVLHRLNQVSEDLLFFFSLRSAGHGSVWDLRVAMFACVLRVGPLSNCSAPEKAGPPHRSCPLGRDLCRSQAKSQSGNLRADTPSSGRALIRSFSLIRRLVGRSAALENVRERIEGVKLFESLERMQLLQRSASLERG